MWKSGGSLYVPQVSFSTAGITSHLFGFYYCSPPKAVNLLFSPDTPWEKNHEKNSSYFLRLSLSLFRKKRLMTWEINSEKTSLLQL